ncbi:hypothetical protein D3C85_825060 [compost metagenome]
MTVELPQPSEPASLNPYNKPPKPRVEKMTPRTSSLGVDVLMTFFIEKEPKINANRDNGKMI